MARILVAGRISLVVAGTPQAFQPYIGSEIAKWAKVVKSAGIKPE
jgi:hypothetical protein